MKNIGFYAGSFDPLTNGHVDIIRQATCFCTRLVLGIGIHSSKTSLFSTQERINHLQALRRDPTIIPSTCELDAIAFEGLAVKAAQEKGAHFLIRGLRNSVDFDYELQMSDMNRVLDSQLSTLFLVSSPQTRYISSTLIKQIAQLQGDLRNFVPPWVEEAFKNKRM